MATPLTLGMPLRLGMVGASPGNGHPFSFSAIINGYDDAGMAASGWDGIHRYLARQDRADIGLPDAQVTHVWTQDPAISKQIAAAAHVEHIAEELSDLQGAVDAVIIARDDHATHAQMAMPFLQAGTPVFVDKPLTLDRREYAAFRPFLQNGLLMSCSGLRFAREMDGFRGDPDAVGKLVSVQCGVINGWDKYGVHMIDAVLGAFPQVVPGWVVRHGRTWTVGCADDVTLSISCLGGDAPYFGLQVLGERGGEQLRISDNFTAFRRTLQRFVAQVRTGEPAVSLEQTERSLGLLMAGADLEPGVATPIPALSEAT